MKEKYIINGEYKKNEFYFTFHKIKNKTCLQKIFPCFLNPKNKLI